MNMPLWRLLRIGPCGYALVEALVDRPLWIFSCLRNIDTS
jgi:hypothetical protein